MYALSKENRYDAEEAQTQVRTFIHPADENGV
jgi:hypothetical protein